MDGVSVRRGRRRVAGWVEHAAHHVVGRWVSRGDPAVMHTLGQLVPLTVPWAHRVETDAVDRGDRLAAWTRSGALTYTEAEAVLALDESTPWCLTV